MESIAIFVLAVVVFSGSQAAPYVDQYGAVDGNNDYSDEYTGNDPIYRDDDGTHNDLHWRNRHDKDQVLALMSALIQQGYTPWTTLFTFNGKKGKNNIGSFRKWLNWSRWNSNSFIHSNP